MSQQYWKNKFKYIVKEIEIHKKLVNKLTDDEQKILIGVLEGLMRK